MIEDKQKFPNSIIKVNKKRKHRCPHCGRLFFYGDVKAIEIKCPGYDRDRKRTCGRIISIEQL